MAARFTAGSGAITPALLLTLLPLTTSDRATWYSCKDPWDYRLRALELITDDVTELILKNCNIAKLENNAFNVSMPKLEAIYLSENHIEEIDPAVFVPVANIKCLYLSHNKIRIMPLFGAYSLFPDMLELHLENNRITSLNDSRIFSACVKLEYLYLYNNLIAHISRDVFKPLVNLEFLSLSNNQIKIIPDGFIQVNSLKFVLLDDNLIEYVSPNAFTSKSLSDLVLVNNRIRFLPSDFVSIFTPKKRRSFLFYNNPWQCGCLLELIMDLKRAGVDYENVWQYDGATVLCVFQGRMACVRDSELATN